jgi:acyl-CoA-binding protein
MSEKLEKPDDLDYKFNKYISKVKKLETVSNEDKLHLYARYKQAFDGNNSRDKPSLLNITEMAKWKAWADLKDMSRDDAKKEYIKKVKDLWKNIE